MFQENFIKQQIKPDVNWTSLKTLLYDRNNYLTLLTMNKQGIHVKQDVFVKHECPRHGHSLRNVTFIFDLDLCR